MVDDLKNQSIIQPEWDVENVSSQRVGIYRLTQMHLLETLALRIEPSIGA